MAWTSAPIAALEYILANDIKVSNSSWGNSPFSQALRDAIEATQAIGHIFVASAGNEREDIYHYPHYPASFDLPNIISVASTDNDDRLAYSSSYGLISVDLGAPGVNIYSTIPGSYSYKSGTSMAAPHVTGVFALVMSRRPDWPWQQVIQQVFAAVRPVDSLAGITFTGGVVRGMNVGDCNENGIDDELDIAGGTSQDCSGNGIPDECEPDCNGNGAPDSCDIHAGTSEDCDANAVPDDCQPDCNANDIADYCDLTAGTSEDCNLNLIPDECEPDCDANGTPDECEIAEDLTLDCNVNGALDECDLNDSTSEDCNGNLVPDECETTLRVLIVGTAVTQEFVAGVEQAGHFVTQVRTSNFPSDLSPYDVLVLGHETPSQVYRSAIDEFVEDGNGLLILVDPAYSGGLKGRVNPVIDMDGGWTYRSNTQVVDPGSALVSGLGQTSTLKGDSIDPVLRFRAQTVVTWSDGAPMAITYAYGAGKVVYFNDLGAGYRYNWLGDTDYGTTLMHNALDYVGVPSGDCDRNGVPDDCDIAGGTIPDSMPPGGDGIPDACQFDCNGNGIPDRQEIVEGTSPDCQPDGIPDACGLAAGNSTDCDDNGVPDECETDCNNNGVLDSCDIAEGASVDDNRNGIPDECDVIIFVNAEADPGGDGQSWATAHNDLQTALDDKDATELWVAAGTYRPAEPGGERYRYFDLDAGVRICGGFSGQETYFTDRDFTVNATILSGDLNSDDGPDWTNREDNSFNVLVATHIYPPERPFGLDGLIITGGNAIEVGGEFRDGGGIEMYRAGRPTMRNCIFTDNSADYGGGVSYTSMTDPTFIDCTFSDNWVHYCGAGMYGNVGSATLVNCTFRNNSGDSGKLRTGGGYDVYAGAVTLINCAFDGNWAQEGGGMYAHATSEPTLINCTFSGNTASTGGGLYSETPPGGETLVNCIFWGNSDDGGANELAQIFRADTELNVNYSCIQGWTGAYGGVGNFGDDPLFVDADGNDDVIGTPDDNLRLSNDSPCVDAGDSTLLPEWVTTDLDGRPRFVDVASIPDTGAGAFPFLDLGAYEQASDCNENGIIDQDEIAWGMSSDCNSNNSPDECDLAAGASEDCNSNDVPDECDPDEDCNNNGIQDICDVGGGTSEDCNFNEVPDECEPNEDCNDNGTQDICDIASGFNQDCNENNILDECDVDDGTSPDVNGNGVPDECENPPAPQPGGPACSVAGDCTGAYEGADCAGGSCYVPKNRYLSIDPTVNETLVAYQVTLAQSVDYPSALGRTWWVDEPICYDYPNGAPVLPEPVTCEGPDRFGWVAQLTSDPVTRRWTEVPLHVTGCGLAPVVTYEIRTTPNGGTTFSAPLEINTIHNPVGDTQSWGDIAGGPVDGMPGLWLPPELSMSMADVQAAIRTFENVSEDTGAPPRVWVDIEIDQVVNLGDVQFIVKAFEGVAYGDIQLPLIGIDPADCP